MELRHAGPSCPGPGGISCTGCDSDSLLTAQQEANSQA